MEEGGKVPVLYYSIISVYLLLLSIKFMMAVFCLQIKYCFTKIRSPWTQWVIASKFTTCRMDGPTHKMRIIWTTKTKDFYFYFLENLQMYLFSFVWTFSHSTLPIRCDNASKFFLSHSRLQCIFSPTIFPPPDRQKTNRTVVNISIEIRIVPGCLCSFQIRKLV